MATTKTKAAGTVKKTKRVVLVLSWPEPLVKRLERDARRAGLHIEEYLLTCAREFGHNLWSEKIGGTD